MNAQNHNTDNTASTEWGDAWRERLAGIDDRIISYMEYAGETTGESLDNLSHSIRDWLDTQTLPEQANVEWQKLRADSKLLKARIENRIAHLVADGRLKVAQWRAEHRG